MGIRYLINYINKCLGPNVKGVWIKLIGTCNTCVLEESLNIPSN